MFMRLTDHRVIIMWECVISKKKNDLFVKIWSKIRSLLELVLRIHLIDCRINWFPEKLVMSNDDLTLPGNLVRT